MEILKDVSMREYSNMKIGGLAKELVFIENKDELPHILTERKNIFLLGNGTNTLIDDKSLNICFISLKKMQGITVEKREEDYDLVRVESGLDLNDLIKYMEENNYSGLENLAGIPGSVGGLVNMNGGAYGTEIFDCIEEVEIIKDNGEIKNYKKNELTFKYRTTEIKQNKWIIISTLFRFTRGFDKECAEDKYAQREMKHPLDLPNLGSTFKNPEGTFAAQLISDAGLKGYRIGDIAISEKHPNFLTNLGNAKFDDVLQLIEYIKEVVKNKFNIELETEIIILKGN